MVTRMDTTDTRVRENLIQIESVRGKAGAETIGFPAPVFVYTLATAVLLSFFALDRGMSAAIGVYYAHRKT